MNNERSLGSAVFVLNTNDRSQIRLFVGSSTDYTMNTECNDGQPATNDGAINCLSGQAEYIHIMYDDTVGSSLVYDELYVFKEFDAA